MSHDYSPQKLLVERAINELQELMPNLEISISKTLDDTETDYYQIELIFRQFAVKVIEAGYKVEDFS